MKESTLEALKFPIGRFTPPAQYNSAAVADAITTLEDFPKQLAAVLERMDTNALAYSYRPGGWTAAQVIHHLADSHINSFMRFKQCYLQDGVHIMPYDENAWALHQDAQLQEVAGSVQILTGLHHRWVTFLKPFQQKDWEKTFYHPGYDKHYNLWTAVALYAWHSKHHLGHLELCCA